MNALDFQTLKTVLPEKFEFIPNSGNLGDCLIAYGTYEFFKQKSVIFKSPNNTKVFVYGGGGGVLEGYYDHAYLRIKKLLKKGYNGTILPHTIKGFYSLFIKYKNQLKIICREKYSYQNLLEKGFPEERLFLCDDLALFLQETNIVSHYTHKPIFQSLLALRQDQEKNVNYSSSYNIDISGLYNSDCVDASEVEAASKILLLFLSLYETVVTDRLHIAIACCLLNRKCYLLGGSYYKNKAVFQYSLQRKYKNIKFVESVSEIPDSVLQNAKQGINPNEIFPKLMDIRKVVPKESLRRRIWNLVCDFIPSSKLREQLKSLSLRTFLSPRRK